MKVYHGTNAQIKRNELKIMDVYLNGRSLGAGLYLTPSREKAEMYGNNVFEFEINDSINYLSNDEITLSDNDVAIILETCQEDDEYFVTNWFDATEIEPYLDELTEIYLESNCSDVELLNGLFNEGVEIETVVKALNKIGRDAIAKNDKYNEICVMDLSLIGL